MFHFTELGFAHSFPTLYGRYTYKEGNELIFLHSIFILFESYEKVSCVEVKDQLHNKSHDITIVHLSYDISYLYSSSLKNKFELP